MNIAYPYLQFRSNSLYQYNLVDRDVFKSRICQERLTKNLTEQKTYTGLLKIGAKKRLTKALEFLVMSTPARNVYNPHRGYMIKNFRLSFITLTLAETERNIQAKEAYKACLAPFLRWMRESKGVKSYVWKAELQKRGQIHYHITCDSFIDCLAIKQKWNELQLKAGYLDNYFKNYGNFNPPSIEIKKVWKEKDLAGYLQKEFGKAYQNSTSVGGKVWDCSQNLKKGGYFTGTFDCGYQAKLEKLVAQREVRRLYTDHVTIFKFINKPTTDILTEQDRLLYNDLMSIIRNDAVIVSKKSKRVEIRPQNKVHKISFYIKNKYHNYQKEMIKVLDDHIKRFDQVFNPCNLFDFPDIYAKNLPLRGVIEIGKNTFSSQ